MKSIAILINTLSFGGAEKQAAILSNLLCNEYKVTLIILNGDLIENRLLNTLNLNNVNLIKIKQGSWINKLKQISVVLKQENTNVLFTYLAQSNVFGIVAGKYTNTKKIYSGVRSNRIPKKKKIVQRFIHNYLNTGTIFNNFSGKNSMLLEGFNPDKCIVIPNGIKTIKPLNNKTLERKENENKVVILSLGRFIPVKNFSNALTIISKLIKSNPKIEIKYKLGGYGQEEDMLRSKVKELNIENNVEFIINPSNIEDFYMSGDIFLSSSQNEGTPNAIMEAMTFGLPIVGTDAGDTKFLVRQNENGFVSDTNNINEIANNLSKLVNDSELRIKMGEKSFDIISNEYSLEKLKEEYIKLIEDHNE